MAAEAADVAEGGVTAAASQRGELRARLVGIGAAAPDRRVANSELEAIVETSDEWISQRTGIGSRHLLAPDEGLSDLASKAAKDALAQAGIDPLDVELVIMATSVSCRRTNQCPGLQQRRSHATCVRSRSLPTTCLAMPRA